MPDPVSEQIAALKDYDWAIREDAAKVLGVLKDSRAVVPLISLLRDADRAVRQSAIHALIAIGESSVPALSGYLDDGSLQVQEAVSEIL